MNVDDWTCHALSDAILLKCPTTSAVATNLPYTFLVEKRMAPVMQIGEIRSVRRKIRSISWQKLRWDAQKRKWWFLTFNEHVTNNTYNRFSEVFLLYFVACPLSCAVADLKHHLYYSSLHITPCLHVGMFSQEHVFSVSRLSCFIAWTWCRFSQRIRRPHQPGHCWYRLVDLLNSRRRHKMAFFYLSLVKVEKNLNLAQRMNNESCSLPMY